MENRSIYDMMSDLRKILDEAEKKLKLKTMNKEYYSSRINDEDLLTRISIIKQVLDL